MPNLAHANRRDRKHWKAAHRMPIHSAHLRVPSSAAISLHTRRPLSRTRFHLVRDILFSHREPLCYFPSPSSCPLA